MSVSFSREPGYRKVRLNAQTLVEYHTGMIEVHLVRALKDNYVAVVRDTDSDDVLIVDPSEPRPVLNFLDERGWEPSLILNTHHHWDHVGGNDELSSLFQCQIVASEIDGQKIHGVGRIVKNDDKVPFGEDTIRAIHIPGHTLGHTAFYFEKSKILFAGDTLFSMGCGRLFEGTAEQMWTSLSKLMELPDDTKVYCGHEYTVSNARFALSIEPENMEIRRRDIQARLLQEQNLPTIPSTMALEKKTNPFLRVNDSVVRAAVGIPNGTALDVFTQLREMKNTFA